jgi:hypothetical protein
VKAGPSPLVLVLLGNALVCGRFDKPAHLAVTVTVALLANAFACGALSGPHDRYGARIVWIATLTAAITLLQAIASFAANRGKAHATAAP